MQMRRPYIHEFAIRSNKVLRSFDYVLLCQVHRIEVRGQHATDCRDGIRATLAWWQKMRLKCKIHEDSLM